MSQITKANGRLGNQIFRNIATSLIAKHHDLKVIYGMDDLIQSQLGIPLYCGPREFPNTAATVVTDDNFTTILDMKEGELQTNVCTNASYFQSHEISTIVWKTIRSDPVRSSIISHNPYRFRYGSNSDIFVHMRLGDVPQHSPGVPFFISVLEKICQKNPGDIGDLYIASDSPDHIFVRAVISWCATMYPKLKIHVFVQSEIETLQFGSTCKYLILSDGSYSALLGYLAFDTESTVYYKHYNRVSRTWCGDMFTDKTFIEVSQPSLPLTQTFNDCNVDTNGERCFYNAIKGFVRVIFDVGCRSDSMYLDFPREVHYFDPVKQFIIDLQQLPNQNHKSYFNDFGLSNETKIMFYYPRYESFLDRTKSCRISDDSNKLELRVRTAKEYIEEQKLPSVDFVKIDTEGFELNVLQGFGDRLNTVKFIQFEYGGTFIDRGIKLHDVITYLELHGFVKFSYLVGSGTVRMTNFDDHYQYCNIVCVHKDWEFILE